MNKYLVDKNVIVGPVTMEKPEFPNSNNTFEIASWAKANQDYQVHVASLPRYPISGVHNWKDGELIGECEVKLQKQARSLSSNYSWRNEGDIYDIADPGFRRIVAIPVNGKEDEKDFQKTIEGDYVFDRNKWKVIYAGDMLLVHKIETTNQ